MVQQFTNFCCRSGGSNLNAGTRTGDDTVPGTGADFTYASGNWVAGTGVFTVASGNPSSDGVAVGDFASVYANGSTVTGFVGRITARDATTITVSLSAKSGTAPTDGTGDRTLKVGGAWRGPDSTTTFPIAFIKAAMKDTTGRLGRVNFKNDVTYQLFTVATLTEIGGITFQGFTSAYGDFGKAEIDGDPTAALAYSLIIVSFGGLARPYVFKDLILGYNGDEGGGNIGAGHSHQGVLAYHGLALRCSAHDTWCSSYEYGAISVECEGYHYNFGGIDDMGCWTTHDLCVRCFVHTSDLDSPPYDISAINNVAFHTNDLCYACIASDITGKGYDAFSAGNINCEAFNCSQEGIELRGPAVMLNSSACQCGEAGLAAHLAQTTMLEMRSCRFGTGTQANGIDFSAPDTGTITGYTEDLSPWVDAESGNFTLFLDEAFEAGRGSFTQTAPGYSGSVSYPDIGAARHETHVRNLVLPPTFGGGMA